MAFDFIRNENMYENIYITHADYHVVGCGDRTVSMWDHRNGNLLIDIEIELPTIGQNIGCYTVGDDVSTHKHTYTHKVNTNTLTSGTHIQSVSIQIYGHASILRLF